MNIGVIKMTIRDEYVERAVEAIMKIDPTLDKKSVEKLIDRITKERMSDPTIIMDNNVTGNNQTISLSKLCGWIKKEKPIISGNATFYCQPEVLQSPTSNMLHTLKVGRSQVKKEMFKYDPKSDEYAMLDLDQQNKKVIMNAEYGGSGTPTAAFYTKYSPAATTLMAQSIITTMAAFFESYVGDNQKFFSVNECYDWMHEVLKKKDKIPSWIKRRNADETYKRVVKHFITIYPEDIQCIKDYISNLDDDQLTYMYYANNSRF